MKTVRIFLFVILGVVVAVGGAYWYVQNQKVSSTNSNPPVATSTTRTSTQIKTSTQNSDTSGTSYIISPSVSRLEESPAGTGIKGTLLTGEVHDELTFKNLEKIDEYLSKNKSGVYYQQQNDSGGIVNTADVLKIYGADPATFMPVPPIHSISPQIFSKGESSVVELFYKDQTHVYQLDEACGLDGCSTTVYSFANVDILTFQNLNSLYIKDKNAVYLLNYYYRNDPNAPQFSRFLPIAGADPRTFAVVGLIQGELAKDSNHAYWNGDIAKNLDSSSLVNIDGYFAKDKNGVYSDYSLGKIMVGADPASFVSLGRGYGKDTSGVYNIVVGRIEGADVSTFVSVQTDNGLGYGPDAKDKNHQYEVGEIYSQ